jgi:hypothetical protein
MLYFYTEILFTFCLYGIDLLLSLPKQEKMYCFYFNNERVYIKIFNWFLYIYEVMDTYQLP